MSAWDSSSSSWVSSSTVVCQPTRPGESGVARDCDESGSVETAGACDSDGTGGPGATLLPESSGAMQVAKSGRGKRSASRRSMASLDWRDEAAISFASAFYQALAYGRSVSTAFKLGCVQIDLESLDEQDTPQLLAQRANPAQVVFA